MNQIEFMIPTPKLVWIPFLTGVEAVGPYSSSSVVVTAAINSTVCTSLPLSNGFSLKRLMIRTMASASRTSLKKILFRVPPPTCFKSGIESKQTRPVAATSDVKSDVSSCMVNIPSTTTDSAFDKVPAKKTCTNHSRFSPTLLVSTGAMEHDVREVEAAEQQMIDRLLAYSSRPQVLQLALLTMKNATPFEPEIVNALLLRMLDDGAVRSANILFAQQAIVSDDVLERYLAVLGTNTPEAQVLSAGMRACVAHSNFPRLFSHDRVKELLVKPSHITSPVFYRASPAEVSASAARLLAEGKTSNALALLVSMQDTPGVLRQVRSDGWYSRLSGHTYALWALIMRYRDIKASVAPSDITLICNMLTARCQSEQQPQDFLEYGAFPVFWGFLAFAAHNLKRDNECWETVLRAATAHALLCRRTQGLEGPRSFIQQASPEIKTSLVLQIVHGITKRACPKQVLIAGLYIVRALLQVRRGRNRTQAQVPIVRGLDALLLRRLSEPVPATCETPEILDLDLNIYTAPSTAPSNTPTPCGIHIVCGVITTLNAATILQNPAIVAVLARRLAQGMVMCQQARSHVISMARRITSEDMGEALGMLGNGVFSKIPQGPFVEVMGGAQNVIDTHVRVARLPELQPRTPEAVSELLQALLCVLAPSLLLPMLSDKIVSAATWSPTSSDNADNEATPVDVLNHLPGWLGPYLSDAAWNVMVHGACKCAQRSHVYGRGAYPQGWPMRNFINNVCRTVDVLPIVLQRHLEAHPVQSMTKHTPTAEWLTTCIRREKSQVRDFADRVLKQALDRAPHNDDVMRMASVYASHWGIRYKDQTKTDETVPVVLSSYDGSSVVFRNYIQRASTASFNHILPCSPKTSRLLTRRLEELVKWPGWVAMATTRTQNGRLTPTARAIVNGAVHVICTHIHFTVLKSQQQLPRLRRLVEAFFPLSREDRRWSLFFLQVPNVCLKQPHVQRLIIQRVQEAELTGDLSANTWHRVLMLVVQQILLSRRVDCDRALGLKRKFEDDVLRRLHGSDNVSCNTRYMKSYAHGNRVGRLPTEVTRLIMAYVA